MSNIEDLDKTKKDSIDLANKIYKTISHPEIVANTTSEERHEICVKRYEIFAKAYPLVLAKMAVELRYNEKAFIKFLDNLYNSPGEGMEGIIKNQAYYAKVLYMEECKAMGKRWCPKTAKDIFEYEYKNMIRWVDDTKKIEKKVKNEFEEEDKKHQKELREEFKQWFLKEKENFTFDKSGNIENIEELIEKDEEYQKYIKTNEIIVKENTTPDENSEKQELLNEALRNRREVEEKLEHDDWVSNSIVKGWNNNKKRNKKVKSKK